LFAGIADDQVGEVIAAQVEPHGAGFVDGAQGLDLLVGGECVVRVGAHLVGALTGSFHHQVPAIVDDVDVVAAAADQHVGTAATVERVG
jgi:hypothetical protein